MPNPDGAAAVQPVILAVDDEPAVLRAIAGDLRRHYARRYRVVRAQSGDEALQVVAELRDRGARLALVVSDQRMPGMGGVDLLAEVRDLEPEVKAVLLTAYADTDVAIEAINRVRLDYYILKPWDPPEEQLFPVLDDLLDDWEAGVGAPVRRPAARRAPLVAGGARAAGVPVPQPRALPLARRRRRSRRGRPAARRRDPQPAGGGHRGRPADRAGDAGHRRPGHRARASGPSRRGPGTC